jgi:hypothetical protein
MGARITSKRMNEIAQQSIEDVFQDIKDVSELEDGNAFLVKCFATFLAKVIIEDGTLLTESKGS